jgi:hypothetical protein
VEDVIIQFWKLYIVDVVGDGVIDGKKKEEPETETDFNEQLVVVETVIVGV